LKVTTRQTSLRTIRQGSKDFMLNDGLVTSPRAGFEISEHCPKAWVTVIQDAIELGYIKPVAYVYDYELMWDKLNDR
jgi:hypothetical protein